MKVLITDNVHPLLVSGLVQAGAAVDFIPDYNPARLREDIHLLDGIVINSKIRMDRTILAKARKLKFIGRLGSGLEIIDLKAAKEMNIAVFNSPEGNRNAVSEHVLGMLLCLSNNLIRSDHQVRNRIWHREENRGFELSGKTIGIVGLGNTGKELATKLSSWALELIYYDPYVLDYPEGKDYISKVEKTELTARADIISFHVPLTDETKYMVDDRFIENCKEGVIIVNTSRGKVVDIKSLLRGLHSGHISGACLDVFENEKPHHFTPEEDQLYSELYALPNVVLSPHIAGWTHESLKRIAEVLLAKIKSVI